MSPCPACEGQENEPSVWDVVRPRVSGLSAIVERSASMAHHEMPLPAGEAERTSGCCVYLYRYRGTIVYVGRGTSPQRALDHTTGSHNAELEKLILGREYEIEVAGPYPDPETRGAGGGGSDLRVDPRWAPRAVQQGGGQWAEVPAPRSARRVRRPPTG